MFLRLLIFLCLASLFAHAQTDHLANITSVRQHPRLLLEAGGEKAIARNVANDPLAKKLHEGILAESDRMLALAPQERIKIGRRLLSVSREALRRLFFLSYAYRMSGQTRYAKRAEAEMLAISAFSDWNPSHFLDVGEMTMALAIGYDWTFDQLPEASRNTIRTAIRQKGIDASLVTGQNNWLKATNNWNQVCNAGMVYGAIATYEDDPAMARTIINRALNTVTLSMGDYVPDGAYPEGYSYWGYGTSFNVMLISALENLFGSSFGLANKQGFLPTAAYLENMTGPSGLPFNYSDAGNNGGLQPAMFWFAQRQKDPSLLWMERYWLQSGTVEAHLKDRILPAALLWLGDQTVSNVSPPTELMWWGAGKNPVALMRTSWTDPNAIYVGVKGGSPSVSHAHMDAGTFVMDADGVRWAMDFGMQNYESLESKKVDLWNSRQNSQRWRVFRYNNKVHNTLTVNDSLQRVGGKAPFLRMSNFPNFMFGAFDLSELYAGQLARAARGIAIVDKASVLVRDEVEASAQPATVRWTMLTPASVKIVGPNKVELTKDGKTLIMQVDEPAQLTLKTWPTDPVYDYDAANPGTTLVGFETVVPAQTKTALTVRLIPAKAVGTKMPSVKALDQWGR
ncbi:MAG: heparinase [Cytophagales bacterium]|nr:MAG: heparinase [Cytophagales bacterium]